MLENSHSVLAQTAYRRKISCQDAIFVYLETILSDGSSAYLFLYDLEKAFDSIKYLFFCAPFSMLWWIGEAWCSNLSAVVRSGSTTSASIPILRGIQQGSVLSPTFFLVIMDELLHWLSEWGCGVSIFHLYLSGAVHADDVRAMIASFMFVAKAQGVIILFIKAWPSN